MSLLQIDHLSLAIHGTPILRDISFDLDAGQIVGVIGESGSGKSMTAYSVMQLLPEGSRTDGAISLNGDNLLSLSEEQMCSLRGDELGMVFQEPMTALNPVKSIGDQVAETVRIHRQASRAESLRIARETLDRVELPADRFPLSRYPHELSGGQRQRVVIAMAIALRPKVLIADEPTTALDVTTQAQILKLLQRLVREDNMALMMITHDLAVVSDLADDIVIMKSGEVVETGPAKTLFQSMKHPYTKALFEASSHVPDREADSDAEAAPLLKVSHVSRDYVLPRTSLLASPPIFRAVNDVSFSIQQGESLGLVGESGCGKSTLTRAILGLEEVQEGEILIEGTPVFSGHQVQRSVRRKMQVVFQDPYGSFNPRHRVARLVSEPFHLLDRQPSGVVRAEAIAEALESVGLEGSDGRKYIHEFSGGQRQRIAIARALIIKPKLIVLDEAVSALDVSIRAQILDLLADLSDRFGLTYLFISHDLSVVRSITDRVLVMKEGQIVEEGQTDAVFDNPQHAYTKSLIEAAPRLSQLPAELPAELATQNEVSI
ncbi:ABC transporter ATP-binding protein [Pararhizobium sp. IMCC21322]|uniref:ABC transporter ATP-binding protein n=1 Tax=Pararhizobium sp. IMCC21322 TaxID=3067903 RepID=UPI002741DAD5|nr:dipeptide ABC transporter ATP-binding protein [Pararhizobium sp. IMCC21322]